MDRKKNGELLGLIVAAGFEVFLSVDRNLRHQQSLKGMPFALIVLVARNNKLATLTPLVPELLSCLSAIRPGEIVEIPQTS
jgi:hypothetical protein